jgi:hypothetical protein
LVDVVGDDAAEVDAGLGLEVLDVLDVIPDVVVD